MTTARRRRGTKAALPPALIARSRSTTESLSLKACISVPITAASSPVVAVRRRAKQYPRRSRANVTVGKPEAGTKPKNEYRDDPDG